MSNLFDDADEEQECKFTSKLVLLAMGRLNYAKRVPIESN